MQLTEREQNLLLRSLDKASAPTEAKKAAEALIDSLRERGINGYDFLDGFKPKSTAPPRPPTSQPSPSPRPERAWGKGPGHWIKGPDGITYWVDEDEKGIFFPPNSTAEEIKRMGKMWGEICSHWNATHSPSSGSIYDKINAWKRAQPTREQGVNNWCNETCAERDGERSKQQKYGWEGWSWESCEKSKHPVLSREFKIDLFSVIATSVAVGSLFIAIVCPVIGVPLLTVLIPLCYSHYTEGTQYE